MFGIGCDIEKVGRFREALGDSAFLRRVFTPKELRYCMRQGSRTKAIARIFACKEAVFKALSSLGYKTLLSSIEIPDEKGHGKYFVVKRSGKGDVSYKVFVSSSCAGDLIYASSVAEIARGRG